VAEIKSALELALEKAERYGRASKEDMLQDKFKEEGRQLAVKYLKEEEVDLEKEVAAMPPEAQPAARQAMKEVFLRNIILPREVELDPRQSLALEGIMKTATNPKAMARLKGEVEQLWQQFLMARNTAYQQLKTNFEQTLGNYTRALEAQLGSKVRLEVEHLPEFQQEWRKFEGNLVSQFEPVLEDRKEKMRHL
jgi:cell division protein FtsB